MSTRQQPKKAGYLLKKGPLKVFVPSYTPCPQSGSASFSAGSPSRLPENFPPCGAQVWQKRWFVLEDGELSYYRNVEQVSLTCAMA